MSCGDRHGAGTGERQRKAGDRKRVDFYPRWRCAQFGKSGKVPLEWIEVQTEAYLGEDDIVRLKDRYGRVGTQG